MFVILVGGSFIDSRDTRAQALIRIGTLVAQYGYIREDFKIVECEGLTEPDEVSILSCINRHTEG